MMHASDRYRRRLETELASIRSRRVNLRKRLEFLKHATVGDATETQRLRREAEMFLSATDREWELANERLGRDPYPKPVRLLPPGRVQVRTVTRSVPAGLGYMTRAMTGRG